MSGPRVTSGAESRQDFGTPADLLGAVGQRFGEIKFDLAAHRTNHIHERYFAPSQLIESYDPVKTDPVMMKASLTAHGAHEAAAAIAVNEAVARGVKAKVSVQNLDPDAYGFDAFAWEWAAISAKFANADGSPGLEWLNCEFGDVAPWAAGCDRHGKNGANITLLTPAQTGANWSRDHVYGRADVYHLNGRVCFDGKNPFPKDCMVSHYHAKATGAVFLWDWKHDRLLRTWKLIDPNAVAELGEIIVPSSQVSLF